ncbi:MAG: glycosyltransferase 61 family protein [Burkholderiales bacterium]|nr:glycosyltransferase 61 family protein [Burkholderiales bacterium]
MGIFDRIIARLRDAAGRPQADALAELHRQLAQSVRGGTREGTLALCDAILARAPDDRAALLAAAVNRLKTGEAERAAAHFARIEALDSGGARTARLLTESFMDAERAGRAEPYVATLDEVLVDADFWSVIDGERIYTRETQGRTISNSPRVRGRVTPDRMRCVMTLPREFERIDAHCILLGSDANYAHWVIRNVLKLALLEDAGLPEGLPYLVAEDLRGWHRETLALLGIPEARLLRVPAEHVYRCRRLSVPTQLRNHPRMALGIDWLRARVARLRAAPGEANALLYASRREQAKRRLVNEDAVEAMLAGMGFRVIVPGEMRVAEQIDAFSRARVVVAPHGAALANMAFAPPGAALVEITSRAIEYMDEMRFLAAAAGQQVRSLVSDDVDPPKPVGHSREMHADYRVDLGALRAMVDEVLALPAGA